MSAAPFCASSPDAAALPDAEFWDRVYANLTGWPSYECDGPDDDMHSMTAQLDPCPECGQVGACGYDDEGRPMIHTVEDTP